MFSLFYLIDVLYKCGYLFESDHDWSVVLIVHKNMLRIRKKKPCNLPTYQLIHTYVHVRTYMYLHTCIKLMNTEMIINLSNTVNT